MRATLERIEEGGQAGLLDTKIYGCWAELFLFYLKASGSWRKDQAGSPKKSQNVSP
jgi:hypothetical protein